MKRSDTLLFAAAALTAAGAQAATFTAVQFSPEKASYERTHAQILSSHFGGEFSAVGNDFSNGDIFVTRVDDDLDHTYTAESWSARALAIWAGADQSFGTVDSGIVFDVTGDRSAVNGEALDVVGGSEIAFARFGDQMSTIRASTNPLDNPSQRDYVVTYTYSVDGDPVEDKYLLFFEDLAKGDFDYNDLVVEVTLHNETPPVNLPEPGSLALLGIGALGMLRRRR